MNNNKTTLSTHHQIFKKSLLASLFFKFLDNVPSCKFMLPINEAKRTLIEWSICDVRPCNVGLTSLQQSLNAPTYYLASMQPHKQSSYRRKDIRMTSFHNIHGNEVREYGSSSRDAHDNDNYIYKE